ncbi:hypothetical protein QRB38_29045, partial [Mycobacterium avium subsp. hominissuis]|nr:hypothetical protein [Mycobacterium avium subsp. hominissuis]
AIAMFLSVVILGRFTTETHAMALLRQGPTRRHHLHHSPGRSRRSLEESRDDLHSSGYDTPVITGSYTTLLDATGVGDDDDRKCVGHAHRS